jgi:hypothetical protein
MIRAGEQEDMVNLGLYPWISIQATTTEKSKAYRE